MSSIGRLTSGKDINWGVRMANGDCVHPPQKGAEGFEECGSTEES